MTTERRMRAWAIDTGADTHHGFIGVGWFGWERPERADYALTTATFRTRAAARIALRKVTPKAPAYQAFPRARVVPVEIIVRTVWR